MFYEMYTYLQIFVKIKAHWFFPYTQKVNEICESARFLI